ncbi:MAG TPA: glycosyltransferase family 2 protein [Candidatus Binataceae bacterium]|nr:glycosyltransferase family 2 protein [Candidatus Binataceae bacterium]
MALITTVIPTFRRPELLRRAILSVLAQDFADFEVAVYDDCSGDDTAAVVGDIMRRDARVKYFRHPNNVGMMPNFAYAMNHVESPYFSILSDDDILLPGFFTVALSELEREPRAGFFIGNQLQADLDGRIIGEPVKLWAEGFSPVPSIFKRLIRLRSSLTWTGMVFRTSVIRRSGGLDLVVGSCGDVDFEVRAASRHSAIVSHHPSAVFFMYPSSNYREDPFLTWLHDMPRIVSNITAAIDEGLKAGELNPRLTAEMRADLRKGFREWVFRQAVGAALTGRSDLAKKGAGFEFSYFRDPVRAAILRCLAGDRLTGRAARAGMRLALRSRNKRRRTAIESIAPDAEIIDRALRDIAQGAEANAAAHTVAARRYV